MYLGIRPALKARPSLLDLIRGGGDSGGLSGFSGEGSSIAAGSAGSSTATVATRPPVAGGLEAGPGNTIPEAATSSPPPPLAAPRQIPGWLDTAALQVASTLPLPTSPPTSPILSTPPPYPPSRPASPSSSESADLSAQEPAPTPAPVHALSTMAPKVRCCLHRRLVAPFVARPR